MARPRDDEKDSTDLSRGRDRREIVERSPRLLPVDGPSAEPRCFAGTVDRGLSDDVRYDCTGEPESAAGRALHCARARQHN